jgi:PST family polysaccharide transporter
LPKLSEGVPGAPGSALDPYFDDHRIEEGHGSRSLRGGAVSVLARGVNALIQIGSVLFLARLLSPEDYGLVSMVAAVTGFAPVLVDLGTRDAVVQRSRVSRGEVSALFWITMAIGIGSGLLVAAAGPLIARFYGEPRLTMIALVSSLTFVASALACQHQALMRRAMLFQALGTIETVANVLSAIGAIALALAGSGYWALVLRPIATAFFLAAGVWFRCGWMPTRPTMTPGVREMIGFGLNSTGFTMTDFVGRSVDRIAIGYRSGAVSLGYYQNARFVYDNLLDVLVAATHGVAVASLSKLRQDPVELRRLWAKALSTLAFYAMPAFGVLAVVSEDLIVLLLGRKWENAGILLAILALRGIPNSVERTLGWLHVTAGRTDRWMKWGVLATGAHLVALFVGLPFGPMGVVVAYVVCMYILFVPALGYAGQPLGISARDVVQAVGRQLIAALSSAAIAFLFGRALLGHADSITRMALLSLVYLGSYLLLAAGVFKVRVPLTVMRSLIRDTFPRRVAHQVS